MILKDYRLTTMSVYYWMPDYNHILQQFVWQYMDVPPEFVRSHRFLNYWKENIEAIIEEVTIAHGDHNPWDLQVTDDYRVLDFEKNI